MLKVMLFIIYSPYLFNVEATAFASIRAENTMPIVFKKLFVFILFSILIRSFSNSCYPVSDSIV
ncbi:hypothetical protein CN917_16900 [Bacillus thuringiensis]|uniref:Uncharacterized protein n=1 Tax=Bacillus thuringiensis TaxID=1428 RepID=A0A9X7FZG5_BACTU|nr:hypothetical protein CSW12_28575 [Bacillus cereus]OTW52779.1 hypothetical protein BK703_21065 [Bacillus thuringiensis serovar silo]OTW58168.1 hypothetical protein BK700_29055 [Bacillus thuringiensis serovar toguchini]OTZ60692.1 hypothetical protein BK767_31075 [Bacillus thuringiensis serovar kyushuensis]OTZ63216.1 hypothetical protein BK768_31605 [Bacillus thuringiensis serovar tohokuensis]OTZ82600.1 hypothetical protein BK771_24950 [Bacillus thuringiensis serovar ostriniae]PDY57685.1 hypo